MMFMNKRPSVYILANRPNGTLYVGVTSDLIKRIWQHKNHFVEGFTARHEIYRLVWYEMHETMENAITREKLLKRWHRPWKIRLIEEQNPGWNDLYNEIAE
jgi:putative endonuclease